MERERLVDQLHRSVFGDSWTGSSVAEVLQGVTSDAADFRAITGAHTIHEILLHIWDCMLDARRAIGGEPMPPPLTDGNDWPAPQDGRWEEAVATLYDEARQLETAIRGMSEASLSHTVPGRTYSFYHLLHGVVQHNLYHAGQVVLLGRAFATRIRPADSTSDSAE